MAQQQHNPEFKPIGFIATSLSLLDVSGSMPTKCPDAKTQSSLISEVSAPPQPVMNVFEPFIHERSVSLSSDMFDPTSIKISRASQSLLLSDTVVF